MKNRKPKVTVACITYNHAPYILKCLEGIFMQVCDFDFEVIIHDDCSTDETQKLITGFVAPFEDRVTLIFQTVNQYSRGKKPLIDFILPQARGEYIAFCEGDDYWIDPTKLQKQVSYFEKNPEVSLCCHNALVKDHQTGLERIFNDRIKNERKYTTSDVILRSWIAATASIMFRAAPPLDFQGYKGPGDIMLMFIKSLDGCIYYDATPMSVYNYATVGSQSVKLVSNSKFKRLVSMYSAKFDFLHHADKISKFRFVHVTTLKRVRMIIGFLYQMVLK